MTILNDISILIVTKLNDKKRFDNVFTHIRKQYPDNEIVIVYDNITENFLNNEKNLIQICTAKNVYVSGGYNLAVKNSTKPYFVFLHDDTYTAPNFLENLLPHLDTSTFCNFITIEPPLFGNIDSIYRPIKDLGKTYESFSSKSLNEFYYEHIKKLKNIVEPSIYGGFFMAGNKDSFLSIGGFDENFKPYFHEDSDLMIRLNESGFKFKFILNSLVYHLVSQTSRASTDECNSSLKITESIFIKKWKTTFEYYKKFSMLNEFTYSKPKICIEKINCENELINFLNLFHDDTGDIKLIVDGNVFSNEDVKYILQLPYLINEIKENGTYQIGSLKLIK